MRERETPVRASPLGTITPCTGSTANRLGHSGRKGCRSRVRPTLFPTHLGAGAALSTASRETVTECREYRDLPRRGRGTLHVPSCPAAAGVPSAASRRWSPHWSHYVILSRCDPVRRLPAASHGFPPLQTPPPHREESTAPLPPTHHFLLIATKTAPAPAATSPNPTGTRRSVAAPVRGSSLAGGVFTGCVA